MHTDRRNRGIVLARNYFAMLRQRRVGDAKGQPWNARCDSPQEGRKYILQRRQRAAIEKNDIVSLWSTDIRGKKKHEASIAEILIHLRHQGYHRKRLNPMIKVKERLIIDTNINIIENKMDKHWKFYRSIFCLYINISPLCSFESYHGFV